MGKILKLISWKGGDDLLKKTKWSAKWIWWTSVILIILVLGVSCAIDARMKHRLPECNVEITGRIVDNRYNNYISRCSITGEDGGLVRIGDKLYFNYEGNHKTYGLYEITSNTARRIYWEGPGPDTFLSCLACYEGILYPIQEYNGKLLMNIDISYKTNAHSVYNEETEQWEPRQPSMLSYCDDAQAFEETVLFGEGVEIHTLNFQEASFGYLYESTGRHDLWVYTREGGPEQISDEHVHSFYAVGERIYYLVLDKEIGAYVLHELDWGTRSDRVICEWTEYGSMRCFMIEGNTFVYRAMPLESNTESVYTMDLRSPELKEEVIFSIDGEEDWIYSLNLWNGTVYLCTERGLVACDLDMGTHRVLFEKWVIKCDIVDDTWVYFVDRDGRNLWRVPQSGGQAELVLG